MSDTKGLYLGKSHAEGGIPAVNTDTGQHIEVELNEYKICNSAYSSNKILRYSNKTNKEILDDIHDNFSCRFNKNEVKNGEFIICKVVVLDPTKRSRKGTVRQILDEMQSEKSCNVSQGASMLKNGGSISSKKTIIEIDFGNYKENYVLTKDNLEDIWSILLNDKSVVGFAYINKDGFDLYDLEPNKTARVQQVIRLWNKSYKYEKESANYSYGGSYNREKMDKLNKLAKEYQLSANKLISKMNPNELMSLRNEADYDVFGNITEYEYGNSFKNGGEVESLISKAILKLNFYETTPEHAKEFGIEAKKPLYVKNLCVSENERLKGIGKKVLNYLEDYARKNHNDVIFGYVATKASFTKDSRQSFFCDVDMIKNWLHNNGYAINEENNDFHKVVKYADGSNTFDGNNPDIRFEQGGEISEDDKIYKEWTELVNMSASELKAFMKTDEGKDAGLDPKEAKRLGIKSGQESARWIIKMKSTNKDKWTLTMWDWAKRQINFINRMSGNKGKLFDENGMKTRKHTSLLIWGNNPLKKMAK
jgi:GNAT superfamily N-acetyltransferase